MKKEKIDYRNIIKENYKALLLEGFVNKPVSVVQFRRENRDRFPDQHQIGQSFKKALTNSLVSDTEHGSMMFKRFHAVDVACFLMSKEGYVDSQFRDVWMFKEEIKAEAIEEVRAYYGMVLQSIVV